MFKNVRYFIRLKNEVSEPTIRDIEIISVIVNVSKIQSLMSRTKCVRRIDPLLSVHSVSSSENLHNL